MIELSPLPMEEKLASNESSRRGGRRGKRRNGRFKSSNNDKGTHQKDGGGDQENSGGTLRDTLERIHKAGSAADFVIPYNRPIERVIGALRLIHEIEGQDRVERANDLARWIQRLKNKLTTLQTELPDDFDELQDDDPPAAEALRKQVDEDSNKYDKIMDKLNAARERLDDINKDFRISFTKRIAPLDLPFFKDDLMSNRLQEVVDSFKARYLVVDADAANNAKNLLSQCRKDPTHSMEKHLSIFLNLATAKASLDGEADYSETRLISDVLRSLKGSPYGGLAEALKHSKTLYPTLESVCEALYEKERAILRKG